MNGEVITILLVIVIGFTTHQGLLNPRVVEDYVFSSAALRLRRQWYRLLTPAFLHSDWGHYAGNALSIYLFGGFLENALGPGALLRFFFVSVLGGSLLCLLLHRYSDYRAIGASGGALGLVFASILLNPHMRIGLFLIPFFTLPGWLFALAYLAYTLWGVNSHAPSISHEAHLGGLLTGALLALAQYPNPVLRNAWLLAAVLLLSGFGLWYYHANPGRAPNFLRFRWRSLVTERARRREADFDAAVDALLDKVARQGIHSLTPSERRVLEEASRRRGGTR